MNKVLDHDTCRSRSDIRSAKDLCRINTSNLCKKELEDAYYYLFDNNLELKKANNIQKDQIKVLTTRISRLTQKNIYSPQKGCNKNTLNEQKEIITELKQANERLVERVRLLNMQLCSAKQFVKRHPLQTKCQNCSNVRNSSSLTLLNTKRSQPNLRTKSTASQYELDITPILLEENIKESKSKDQEECTQNKCKTLIVELQLKIEDLQKALSRASDQYENERKKFTDYENVLSSLKEENLRVRSQARVCDEKLQIQRKVYQELLQKLRTIETQNETVSLELVLEKQRARELETQLKAAEISHNIVEALSQAARARESHGPMRIDDSLMPVAVESLMPVAVESLMRTTVESTLKRTDEPIVDSLTPAESSSLIPVRVNESLAPLRVDESPPTKVEQSDDSGYLEATNKFLEKGGGDTKLDIISEKPSQEIVKTVSDDYKRKKRKGKSRKSKRDSSIESSVDADPSSALSDVSEIHKDKIEINNIENFRYNIDETVVEKILKDVGVQSIEKKYVSRAVGELLEGARTDAGVQIGDSLCAMLDVDTRTYTRESNRTYSVKPASARAPPDTECDVSSLSDLSSERVPSDYISPGEAVSSSEYTGASSWSELSDGELPIPRHKLSYGEVDANTSIGEQKMLISPKERIDRAMKTAKEEADRVARLLAGTPVELPGGTVNPLVLLQARYQQTRVEHRLE